MRDECGKTAKEMDMMFTFIRRWQSGQDVPIKTPPQDRCKRECRRISPAGPTRARVRLCASKHGLSPREFTDMRATHARSISMHYESS
ncbi:hypothetical protein K788_00040895 [Paraburkholderia caribensis MBA4]|uniref:Uncharacterized protein n=1 Tax=Paraburkholderia caribensis MBA4 TaxID=1323664 RepID=A0A0P0RG45_9BURK|nr:hypothetical protein K788_00040895 [Paraburkholderia caribensis MBA4]